MRTRNGGPFDEPPTDIDALIRMIEYMRLSAAALSPPAVAVSAALGDALHRAHDYLKEQRSDRDPNEHRRHS
jgi:hypothetical protein